MKTGVLSFLKSMLVPDRSQVRNVPFGLFKGLDLEINFSSQMQLFLGLYERETYKFIRKAAPRAKWFIDVGAGKGELCAYFARLKHVERIIAIEPNHAEAQALIANLNRNKIGSNSVEVLEKFAGTASDDRHIEIDQLNIMPSIHGFIKIDVDGFEFDVLRSSQHLLSQGNADLLIESHSAELEKNCMEFLERLGYTCRVIKNAWWRVLIPELRPIEHNRWFFAEKRMQ